MSAGARPLSPRLVAGLDAARALAACYVVLHHLIDRHGSASGLLLVFRFGQEAVLVFFLLSGFVIFANERERLAQPAGYFLRRLRRIYPTLLAAMALSTLVALDGGLFATNFHWSQLAGTLLSLQDLSYEKPGVIVDPYLDNQPLWSLSYEVAFYIAFPAVMAGWRQWPKLATHVVGFISCAAYVSFAAWPNHWSLVASYFLVWWAGAMAADAYLRGARDLRGMAPAVAWLAALTVVAGAVVWRVGYSGLGAYPFLPFRHFAVALAMLAVLFGPLGRWLASACQRAAKPAAFLASLSYGFYVFHYPLLISWPRAQTPGGLLLALVLLVALSFVADRQLGRWRLRRPLSSAPSPAPASRDSPPAPG